MSELRRLDIPDHTYLLNKVNELEQYKSKSNDIFLRLKSALLIANFDKELREYFLNKITELGEKDV